MRLSMTKESNITVLPLSHREKFLLALFSREGQTPSPQKKQKKKRETYSLTPDFCFKKYYTR